jgi:hypothetical protein
MAQPKLAAAHVNVCMLGKVEMRDARSVAVAGVLCYALPVGVLTMLVEVLH